MVVYSHNAIIYSNEKEQNTATHKYSIEENNPEGAKCLFKMQFA